VRRHKIIHVHVCKEHRERADHSSVEKAKHRQDMTSSRVTGSSNNIWFLTLSKEAYFNTPPLPCDRTVLCKSKKNKSSFYHSPVARVSSWCFPVAKGFVSRSAIFFADST
jgi:hypothetical protein